MEKMMVCKACGEQIAKSAKVCPKCGAKNKKPIYTKWWAWAIVAVAIIVGISNSGKTDKDAQVQSAPQSAAVGENEKSVSSNEKISVFSGDCGISATAEMGTDIIGQPTVNVSVTNTTDKNISAIQFYAIPLDVYGEELKGVFAQNKLSTDNTIEAGKSDTRTWQLLDRDVKTVKLYVYSVYFSDGTEWGDREATKSTIMKNALEITVEGVHGT